MSILKPASIRKAVDVQISPEAIDIVERHVVEIMEAAEAKTKEVGRKRITGHIIRSVIRR